MADRPLAWLGKGEGIVGLGYLATALGALLAYLLRDQAVLIGFAAVVTAAVGTVVAGGAYKAAAEAKNGSGNGAPKTIA